MSGNITQSISERRFSLFNSSTPDWKDSFNLNYLYTANNDLDIDTTKTNLYVQYKTITSSSLNDSILIRNSPQLYVNRYETLEIRYNFTAYLNVEIKLYELVGSSLQSISLVNTLTISSDEGVENIIFVKYFTENKNIIVALELTNGSGFVEIKTFDIYAHEGDKMIYTDEQIIESYSSIEHTFYNYIVNLSGSPLGPSGLIPSVSGSLYYRNVSGLSTTSSGLLYKEFTHIDYPTYSLLPSYTDALIDYSKNVQNNINLKIPQGYIYLLQFILNDMTFTHYPSLELSGIYGNFHNQDYFDPGNTYDYITASGTAGTTVSGNIYATNISGKNIKLHIPFIHEDVIDPRNARNYILKKINILFMKFHNTVFDFCYNYVDYSGNYLGNSPFVQTLFAPAIRNDGSNATVIFEFIRKHTILHYHSVIINDIISRFVDTNDLQNYYRTEQTDCSTSEETVNKLSVEFLELMRLLTHLDQNQNQLYVTHSDGSGPSGYNSYDIYNSDNYSGFDASGYTVSGIHWGSFFKCSQLTPHYSKKISPIIHYTNIYGNSISGSTSVSTISNIKENNAYFYFANSRLQNNSIASGQTIRKNIKDYNDKNICAIDTALFNTYDISGLLLTYDLLDYTPLVPYILYESEIYAQGNNLAPNSVGSNIFLKNMFNTIYKSTIDFTDIYINSQPILFDFINNGLDISGNIIAGRIDNDNVIKTIDAVYMRDIIRASNSSFPLSTIKFNTENVTSTSTSGITYSGYSQQYYIFSVTAVFDLSAKIYITTAGEDTLIKFYVDEDTYFKIQPFVEQLFAKYNNVNYYLQSATRLDAVFGPQYFLSLRKKSADAKLPNKPITLLLFSLIPIVARLNCGTDCG